MPHCASQCCTLSRDSVNPSIVKIFFILTSDEVTASCQTFIHVACVLEGVTREDQPHQYHKQADDGEGRHCPLVVCEMKDVPLRYMKEYSDYTDYI